MPRRKKSKRAVAPAGPVPCLIDALPDGVLGHVLGFVDAREAVRTSLVARRWRHLWKSATGLRVSRIGLARVPAFMDRLLPGRRGAPLDTFDLWFMRFEDGDVPHVNSWVQRALVCRVQELRLSSLARCFPLDDSPLVSQHLRSVQLKGAVLKSGFCDLDGCPSLEHVEISGCVLPCVEKISSQSVKRLSIVACSFNQSEGFRTRICTPNLVSLVLHDEYCSDWVDEQKDRIPVLDSMPSLREASLRLTQKNADCCNLADESGSCGLVSCKSCYGIEDDNGCLLLEGLSEAENLELIAGPKMFVFKRDLKQCPTFSKLKTLLLNDYWCVAPDFLPVNCILKQSPVLEKLTLRLLPEKPKHKLRVKGCCDPMKLSAASKHLKTVDINCEVIDGEIIKIVKFLSTFGISFCLEEAEILEE